MKKSYSKNLFWLLLLCLPFLIVAGLFFVNQRTSNLFITNVHDYLCVPLSNVFNSPIFSWYGDLWNAIFKFKLSLDESNSLVYLLCYLPLYIIVLHIFRSVTQLFCFLFEVTYTWLDKLGVSKDE